MVVAGVVDVLSAAACVDAVAKFQSRIPFLDLMLPPFPTPPQTAQSTRCRRQKEIGRGREQNQEFGGRSDAAEKRGGLNSEILLLDFGFFYYRSAGFSLQSLVVDVSADGCAARRIERDAHAGDPSRG